MTRLIHLSPNRRPGRGACRLLLAVLVALALLAGEAGAQGTTATFAVSKYAPITRIDVGGGNLVGPWSGPISAIAVDPSDDRRVLVASEHGGAFSSADAGTSWHHEDALGPLVQDVAYLPNESLGAGRPCPCAIATVRRYFDTTDDGGVYIAYTHAGSLRWIHRPAALPSPSDCPASRDGWGISIDPDTHDVDVATSCGLAVGRPDGSFTVTTVPGAPSQSWRSVQALGGGKLLLAGGAGVWHYGGRGNWSQATTAALGGTSDVHAFSPDPRGGGRAYYVDDETSLWETQDSGATWSLVPTPPPDAGCGGIPNVHAVQPNVSPAQFKLYYGNRCTTYVVTVSDGAEPSLVVTTGDWAALDAGHPDTRDLAFHPSTEVPYFISSDGGIAREVDPTTFAMVGGPSHGLDGLETLEVDGQYLPGSSDPDLYFATWHDFLWSMDGTSPFPVGFNDWEGGYFGMSRIVNAGERNRLTFTNQAAPEVSDRRFTNGALWPEAPNGMGSPTFLSPGRYVQAAQDGVGRQWEIKYTASEGAAGSWRTIANIGREAYGNPYVAGPRADPTLVQPYLDGTVTDPSSPDFGKDVVHLVSLSGFSHGGLAHSHWPWLATIRRIHAAGSGLGGLGVVTSSGFWYEVLAVDPNDPGRMIAPDVIHGDIRMTTNAGDTWSVIPRVVGQITHAGQYSFTQPAGDDIAPQASAISFCPDNDSRVLMGTRQGGAWFSSDGGQTWVAVPDSDRVTLATSIFWLRGCGGAYIATDGRGLWRVDIAVHLSVNGSCAPPVCHVLATISHYLLKHHPGPSAKRGVVVGDGAITSARLVNGRLRVIVTPGSSVGFYGKRAPGVSISDRGRFVRRRRYTDAVVVANHHLVSFRTAQELRVEPLKRVRIRPGIGRPLLATHGSLLVDGVPRTEGGGAAEIGPDDPLHVSGTIARLSTQPLEIEIDGRPVVRLKPAKQFHLLVEKQVTQSLGKHFIELVAMRGRRGAVLASDTFDVENSDDEPLSAPRFPASLTLTCSALASAGQPFSTVGRLSPALAGSPVSITYSVNGSSVTHSAVVAPDGSYADSLTSGAGQVTVESSWAGNAEYLPAKSNPCVVTVTAAPAPSSISLACPGKATVKGPLTVTGSLSPVIAGAGITVTYVEPNGTIVDQTTTDAQGNFTDTTTAVSSGTWSVSASYGGSAAFAGSTSPPCATVVS